MRYNYQIKFILNIIILFLKNTILLPIYKQAHLLFNKFSSLIFDEKPFIQQLHKYPCIVINIGQFYRENLFTKYCLVVYLNIYLFNSLFFTSKTVVFTFIIFPKFICRKKLCFYESFIQILRPKSNSQKSFFIEMIQFTNLIQKFEIFYKKSLISLLNSIIAIIIGTLNLLIRILNFYHTKVTQIELWATDISVQDVILIDH